MARYQRKKKAPGGSKTKLRRTYKCQRVARWSRNGYLNFLRGFKMRHCGFLSPRDMVRYGAREWRTLTPAQKATYKIKPGSQEYKRIMAKRQQNKKNRKCRPTEAVAPTEDVMGPCHCLQDNAEFPNPEIQPAEDGVVVHRSLEALVPPAGGAAASKICLQDSGESPGDPLLPPAGGIETPSDGSQKDEAGPGNACKPDSLS